MTNRQMAELLKILHIVYIENIREHHISENNVTNLLNDYILTSKLIAEKIDKVRQHLLMGRRMKKSKEQEQTRPPTEQN